VKFADISWRVKVPLSITAVILATEIFVTALLVTQASTDARRDLEASAESLSILLAKSLRDPLLRDDLWQAFEVVTAPLVARREDHALQSIVVLDAEHRVFVSSNPRQMPLLSNVSSLPKPMATVAQNAVTSTRFLFVFDHAASALELAAAGPILAEDGSRLGTVILDFDDQIHQSRVRSAVLNVALWTVPGILLFVPLGWYAGRRLAQPLAAMAHALANVGGRSPEQVIGLLPPESGDEVGQLSKQARLMLDGLSRQAALEREVAAADRLAAVGRVSAAIAHEINNPLGGMLNAIDTAIRHGQPDSATQKALGLLERGLQQIRAPWARYSWRRGSIRPRLIRKIGKTCACWYSRT
jgi:two-component system, NtrC family, sensor kinase